MKHFPNFPEQSGVGYVYFSKRGRDVYKLGRCIDFEKRRRDHQTTDFAFEYEIVRQTIEYKACEDFLKSHFEGNRLPGAPETFAISISEIEQVLPKALRYADALHRSRASFQEIRGQESLSPEIGATDEIRVLYERLKQLRQAVDELEAEADIIKLGMVLAMGDSAGISNFVTYKAQARFALVNGVELREILRRERPDLYERFWKQTIARSFRVL